eukprot:492533_1
MATITPSTIPFSIAHSHVLSPKHFLIWRIIVMLYFCSVLIGIQIYYSFSINFSLTLWTLWLCTLYITVSCYSTYLHFKYILNPMDDLHNKCIKCCKYSTILQVFASSLSVSITVSFWSLLYASANLNDPFNYQVHGITMLATIIDFYFSYNIISFKSTFWYLIIFDIIYSIFSIIWQSITNKPVYPMLDWKIDPIGAVITCVAVSVLTVIIHALLCYSKHKLIQNSVQCEDANASKSSLQENTNMSIDLAENNGTSNQFVD